MEKTQSEFELEKKLLLWPLTVQTQIWQDSLNNKYGKCNLHFLGGWSVSTCIQIEPLCI
jgi:hypothetical protein